MLLHDNPERVLIIGGGEGASLARSLAAQNVKHATMVDIDGELVRQCREHLPEWADGAFEDPRASLIIADGREWLENNTDKFDVIIMDLTDQIDLGPSFQLYTPHFYKTVQSHLNAGGIFVVQAGELSMCRILLTQCHPRNTQNAFPTVQTYIQHVPTFFAQWSFVIAGDSGLKCEFGSQDH